MTGIAVRLVFPQRAEGFPILAQQIESDLPFLKSWSIDEWYEAIRDREARCWAAYYGHHFAGAMLVAQYKSTIELRRILVGGAFRLHGIGSRLIAAEADALREGRAKVFEARVSEYELGLHCFLRSCGFTATALPRRRDEPQLYRFTLMEETYADAL